MKVTPGKAILVAFAGFAAKSGATVFGDFDTVVRIADLHLDLNDLDTSRPPEDFLMGFCGTFAGITGEGPSESDSLVLTAAFIETLQLQPGLARLLAEVTAEECVVAAEQIIANAEEDMFDDIDATDGTLQG